MNITIHPDDIELTLRIDGGELEFIVHRQDVHLKVILSESDMDYLKKRMSDWK